MSCNILQDCAHREDRHLCPQKRSICPARCKPGFCLNAQCLYSTRPEVAYCRPEAEREAKFYQQHIDRTVQQQKSMERAAFLASERRKMGMPEFQEEGMKALSAFKPEKNYSGKTSMLSDHPINSNVPKMKLRKMMRAPARPACMLDVPEICQTYDDYAQLSLLLRTSTMPGYSRNDTVSQYWDTHNMAVWNNRKDIDRQIYKMRRDWQSVWSEQNFKEQQWRKAWQEKLSGGGK